jgi:hypothetical protein
MRPTNRLGAAALTYANLGYRVLPLHHPPVTNSIQGPEMLCSCGDRACGAIGKHPLTAHGLNDATSDPAKLARWWRRWPQANIGLVTGEVADVLDIDGPAGRAALRRFAADHDLRLEGPLVRTGSGWHIYLAPTGTGNRASLLPHVDWRGRGGYVVAPPSRHAAAAATGGYGHSPPNSPQPLYHCTASWALPEPTHLSRRLRHRSTQPLPAIPTAAPRSSRKCPPSPMLPEAAATPPSTRLGFVSTASSPAASSPATRSRPACSPPRQPPGSWSRSQPRPAAPSPPPSGPGSVIPAASQPSTSQAARHRSEGRAGRHEVVRIASGMADPS